MSFEDEYAPSIQAQLGPVTASASRKRVYEALKDPAYNWRSISKLAVLCGLTDDEVVELLIVDENVEFGRGKKSRETIVRLKNRDAVTL